MTENTESLTHRNVVATDVGWWCIDCAQPFKTYPTDDRCPALTQEKNTESRALRIADRIDQAVILNPFQLARVIAILREELTEGYPSVTGAP